MKRTVKMLKLAVFIGLFAALSGCTATAMNESTGQYLDNTLITTKVKTAILKEESLKVLQINVETFKGVVQLSGFVNSAENSEKAETIARSIDNVVSVENNLIVK